MKVLLIVQCTNLGGMEHTASDQARLMGEGHGVQYRAISPRPAGRGAEMFRAIDPDMTFCDYAGRFNWRGQAAFTQAVRERAADVDMIYIVGTCASALRAVHGLNKPVVLGHHFHHGNALRDRIKWRLFYEMLCRRLKGIIYISPFTRDEALLIAPWLKGRTLIARQAVPARVANAEQHRSEQAAARERLMLPQDAWIVGNAGWLIRRKRFDVFLDVVARVRCAVPNARFVICGQGKEEAALRAQAKAAGIAEAVDFRGWVADLDDHYRAWDALLFNSDFDAVGRTALEAAAFGLNVVASVEYGGLGEFFAGGDRGDFFSEHNIAGMADALIALHADPTRAQQRADAALDHLRAVYTPDAAIAPIKALFFDQPNSDRR